MKRLTLTLIATAILAAINTYAAELTWGSDLPKALATAKAEKKVVLVDFTGSDWCGWCIKLKKETFDQPAFADYAKANLVLVELDFPKGKPQSDALKKANKDLQKKYAVTGFPTLVVFDGDGKELGRQVGYLKGGPAAFTKMIDGFKK